MLPKRSFKPAKCKTALNLAKSRIKLMKNKKDIQLKQMRRELAQLLESGQDQTARIRVEHVVREEKMIEAYEMIEIYCELVVARLPIIESQKNCPLDLKEAIASLIFAAPRCGDIAELQDVRKHFIAKYGKEFVSAAVELRPESGVSRNLVEKLSVKAPDGQKKVKILTAIAEEHNIKWEPNWFKDEEPMPSIDVPKVTEAHTAVAHSVASSKIQMQPLNFEIADDIEEKHVHDNAKPGTSSQSHRHTNNELVPPPRSASRPSDNFSNKMELSQPSRTAESTYMTGRHNWNMEFKDATAAAHAAAESAELASRAARAAARLSSGSSSGPGHSFFHDQNEDNQMHRDSNSGSYNQRSPRMENQHDVYKHGSMTEEGDATRPNDDNTQYGVQYETRKQDFIESKTNRRQTRDSDSGPTTSGAEPNMFKPSYFQEHETDSSENPFYEETVERKKESSIFQSQSSAFEDDYGVFANSKYDDYEHDSGDDSFGSFSRKTADPVDWHVPNANTYGKEDMVSKDHKVGVDSYNDIFAEVDHRADDKSIDGKGIDTNAVVSFDESDSDDDDLYVVNPAKERNISSLDEPPSKGFSLKQDSLHYEPDFSESFRKSSIYSKLIEPVAVTFDDSDGENSGSEKQNQKESSDPSCDCQKYDANPHFMRLGTDDSFTNSKHVEEDQSRYNGSVSNHKPGFDDYKASPALYNYAGSKAVATNFESQSDYDVLDKEKPHKPMQIRTSKSQHPVSRFEDEAQSSAEGGMGLNLGMLPGGRRNQALRHFPSGASSPSGSTEAVPSDSLGSTEEASTRGFQVLPNQTDNKQAPMKISRIRMHYDSPDDEPEVLTARKGSNSAEGSYRPAINENVRKVSPKDPTGFFDSDESSSEEDVPKPVMSKTFVGAGLSRRTKGSTPRSVISSETSSAAPKTRQSSVSSAVEVSSSRKVDHSSWSKGEASNDDKRLNSSMAEQSTILKSPKAPETSNSNGKVRRDNSSNKPSHVHPKLPDFETFAATLQSLRKNH